MAQQTDAMDAAAIDTRADIISQVSALVPRPTAFIPELVEAKLPEVISERRMKAFQVKDYLMDIEASGTLVDVLEGPIPHRTWLAKLFLELDKPRESGRAVTAIKHPTREGLILPLWALPVWDSIVVASQERMLWVQATTWLSPGSHRQDDLQYVEGARALMARIPWGMMVWALPGSDSRSLVGILARFISSAWLGERNIDMIGVICNAIAAGGGNGTRSHMAPVELARQLQALGSLDPEKVRVNSDLRRWGDTATDNGYRLIYIPANIAGIHWVVFRIDTLDESYCWGM